MSESHNDQALEPNPDNLHPELVDLGSATNPEATRNPNLNMNQPLGRTHNEPSLGGQSGLTHNEQDQPGSSRADGVPQDSSQHGSLRRDFPREPQRGEIQRLTSSEVADLTPVNAAAAHQDQGLRTQQALNRNRSAIRAGGEHSIMAFRPSTQQTGLNLFKIEKGSPMANGLALAERIAKQLPLTDPPRQGLQQMEALLVRRLTEAEKVSRDWKRINSQLSVIQNFNKFYSGQVRKYESEIWPSTHPVVPDLVKKRMRDGHVALAHTAAEAAKVLAVRGQLLQHSVGYEPTQTLRFQEEYDVGIKKLLKLLEIEPEPGASLYDRIDSIPSPPYSPVHLTVEELEELEVEQVTTQRPTKQPRMGSTANIHSSYKDASMFDMGTDGMDFSQEHPEMLGGSPGVSMGRGLL